MADHLRASPRRRKPARRGNWAPSIRIRVLLIALIPSAALLITGASVAGYLISAGLSARDLAGYMRQNVGPISQLESIAARERTMSLEALGGDRQAQAALPGQWARTDAALAKLSKIGNTAQGLNPGAAASANAAFHKLLAQLPVVRRGVQAKQLSPATVDAFYTRIAGVASPAFLRFALSGNDAAATVDAITMLDLLPVVDGHSRAVGLAAGWAARGMLSQPDRLTVAQLAGAYRSQLQALTSRLDGSETAAYHRLVSGNAWQLATSGEDSLAKRGKLAMPMTHWTSAENTVSAGLLGLWKDSFSRAENSALAAANATLSRSILLGSLVMALAIAAFAGAMMLANGLVRRLRRLRAATLELADEKLPSMVARIAKGEMVDPESEMAISDHNSDEIGQVAEAFNTAQRTAVAAAIAEAKTRSGINKVFLDIAHRSQLVVHRQLELLDVAEARQGDPEHLERLFQLDHLATRARRNAENLVILGGGQPGRRWRQPAVLEDIVRSAVSETEHFARVRPVRLPAVRVQGAVVGDLIHLLAELVDNATAFSPPDSAVTVSGNVVGKGVAVEIEDQGLGIAYADRERLNATLADPPDFQAMALSGQRRLGLFVVGQLAQRHSITVSLLESAYGGTRAIVLIPSAVIEADANPDGSGTAPVPSPRGWGVTRQEDEQRRGWPGREPPAPRQAAPGSPPAPSGRSRVPLPRRERMANLAPGLRPDTEAPPAAAPGRSRSPEEMRGSMSAFQRGTRLARDSQAQDNQ